ncbi:deoxyribodipyrimidine photo-lyase [Pseudomaricurvus sp.]|uniref:deoxyribodipyrimidine photo-lyase n=1 Tax=Pseudomaricurvus sp. TaxID=2004510 RepID=UPI003F6D8CD0
MNLIWLRTDLRLYDNPALYFACQNGKSRVVFCETPEQWQEHHEAPVKLGFRSQLLTDIQHRLHELGIPFEVIQAERFEQLPEVLLKYCKKHKVSGLWFNREIPHDEQVRDQQVATLLQENSIKCHPCDNEFIVPPEQLRTQQGGIYKVFTPWYRSWMTQVSQLPATLLPEPETQAAPITVHSDPVELSNSTAHRNDLWPGTEAAALECLQKFCHERLHTYAEKRDLPGINGTSTLSPYLASGVVSPRYCLWLIQQTYADHSNDWREDPWLRELAWREFYRYLMLNFPALSRDQPFKSETRFLLWESNSENVQAWQQGQTGFPIIDAAMRQLHQTGWMHNRLRMLTASFFTKLLLEDWHLGESYFMEQLIDGDFASNNGGWQWSASTGCDASPWFRVFSPIRQSEKFDPDGAFIRKFVPELDTLDANAIHNPPAKIRDNLGYPHPIIDYKEARERVLTRFENLKVMTPQKGIRH